MQSSIRRIYHVDVTTSKGRRYGRVVDALFDNAQPVVVGYLVERPRLLFVFDRADHYLARDRCALDGSGLHITDASATMDKAAASRLGIDWDLTVIWSNMRVRTENGTEMGRVRDARFDAKSGELLALDIGGGAAADVVVGTREVAPELVRGYRDGFVVVADSVAETDLSGGAAQVAGRTAAVAKVHTKKAVKTATAYGKAAAKVAGESEAGKKAMGWFRSVRDEVKDAMGDPDD